MINRLKDHSRIVTALKETSFRTFMALDRLGVHLLPKHYYTPVPDYGWLRRNRDLWMKRMPLWGVAWDLDAQLRWLDQVCTPHYGEVQGLRFYRSASQYGEGFGEIESQVLHCFIRTMRPARIIEIGSGVLTACMVHALGMEGDHAIPTSITCIEPFPKKAFREIGCIRHIEQYCQSVPDSVFDGLHVGDLLFIDSSHAVKIGSDVVHLCLNVIPRLPPGVFIHIHDICLPYAYNRDALENYLGWQETALVHALLINNAGLEVLCCLSALHYDFPERLAAILKDYVPQANNEGLRPSPGRPGTSRRVCGCAQSPPAAAVGEPSPGRRAAARSLPANPRRALFPDPLRRSPMSPSWEAVSGMLRLDRSRG